MNMHCDSVQPLLDAYSTGTLAAALRQRVGSHVERCASCRAELGQIESLTRILRDTAVPRPAADLASRLAAVAVQRSAQPNKQYSVGLAFAATLVLGVAIGLMLGSHLEPASSRLSQQSVPPKPNKAADTPAPPALRPVQSASQLLAQSPPSSPRSVARPARRGLHAHSQQRMADRTARAPLENVSAGELTISADTVSTVGLDLHANRPMRHVEFVLNIPEGFHLVGHESERRISWYGELKEGNNRMNLHLTAPVGSSGVLVTSVHSAGRSNTFKLILHAAGDSQPKESGPMLDKSEASPSPAASAT